jgi:hypothetical protein
MVDKLTRIVSDRKWDHFSEPLIVFEGRFQNTLTLLSSVVSQKNIEQSIKLEARKQYIVMLVSCYETYLRDTFKEIITNNLVYIDKIKKIKNLKDVKFNIDEVEYIRKNDINLAEILAEYINFQNFDETYSIFSLFGFEKELEKILNSKEEITPLVGKFDKELNQEKIIISFFKQLAKHKNLIDKDHMITKIKLVLDLRHKIVHKNINVSLSEEDILEFTLSVYKFVMAVGNFVNYLEENKDEN